MMRTGDVRVDHGVTVTRGETPALRRPAVTATANRVGNVTAGDAIGEVDIMDGGALSHQGMNLSRDMVAVAH
jgi:hypothetical protein